NYKLSSSSPALGRGVATYAPATDIDDVARDVWSGVDLGAHER
ncbi:choice-of-anchor Q domain-containing protein, partial [Acinetobacter baumannii]